MALVSGPISLNQNLKASASAGSGAEEFPLRIVTGEVEPFISVDGSISFLHPDQPSQAVLTQSESTLDLGVAQSHSITLSERRDRPEPRHRRLSQQLWPFGLLKKGKVQRGNGSGVVVRGVGPSNLSSKPKSAFQEHFNDTIKGPPEALKALKDSSDGVSSTEAATEAAMAIVASSNISGRVAFPLVGTPDEEPKAKRIGGPRRVSFSPSVQDEENAPEISLTARTELNKPVSHERSGNSVASVDGRRPDIRERRSSLQGSHKHGVRRHEHRRSHSEVMVKGDGISIISSGLNSALSAGKAHYARPKLSKQAALAQRHAKVLEQLMNASSPSAAVVVGVPRHQKKAPNHRQLIQLKKALLNANLANGIIGELRAMNIGEAELVHRVTLNDGAALDGSVREVSVPEDCLHSLSRRLSSDDNRLAQQQGNAMQRAGKNIRKRLDSLTSQTKPSYSAGTAAKHPEKSTQPTLARPVRGVCLDCGEAEADRRHRVTSAATDATETSEHASRSHDDNRDPRIEVQRSIATNAGAPEGVTKALGDVAATVEQGPLFSGANRLYTLSQGPSLAGVNAVQLVTSPAGTIAAAGLDASGAFTALGDLSGAAIRATGTNEGVYPPLDRMALFVHWWGYEVTLPSASMSYLGTARSVSGAFLNFLSTMVVTGGVPELLPFVKYVSMAVDVEFKAIQSADRGKGVVLAATWVMPLALVPRAWDYPTTLPPRPPPASVPQPAPVHNKSQREASHESPAAALKGTGIVRRPQLREASRSPPPSPRVRPKEAAVQAAKRESFVGDVPPPSPRNSLFCGSNGSQSSSGTPRASLTLDRLEGIPEKGESLRLK